MASDRNWGHWLIYGESMAVSDLRHPCIEMNERNRLTDRMNAWMDGWNVYIVIKFNGAHIDHSETLRTDRAETLQ